MTGIPCIHGIGSEGGGLGGWGGTVRVEGWNDVVAHYED